jgi:3D (Asp-Asp-Asp) domain-containing protein
MRLTTLILALLFSAALVTSGLQPAEAPEPLEPAGAIMTYRIIEERTMPREEPQEPEPMIFEATAYCYTGNRTATGTWPSRGTIAVDPTIIPLGTRLFVEGYGEGIAEDTGGAIKGEILDLYMESESECWDWGRRQVEVKIIRE